MSNVSIFETRWIDLVFENKNKEYGAYQLRQENPKTTVKALLLASTLFISLFTIPMIFNSFGEKRITDSGTLVTPLIISDLVFPPKNEPEKTDALPPAKKEEPKKEITKENLVEPDVVAKEKATTDVATNEEAKTNPSEGSPEGTGTTPSTGENGNGISGTSTGTTGGGCGEGEAPKGPYVTANLDKMPAYPGGIENFYKYVAKNFRTPEIDNEKTIKVHVSFVIEKDGTMTDIRVGRNPGYGLDKEAIRVLKSLKIKWDPGMIGGKPVRTAYNLPINVQLR